MHADPKFINSMKLLSSIAAITVGLGISGCGTPLKPERLAQQEDRHNLAKNYTIGQQITVNVGEPIIKLQDYYLQVSESPYASPSAFVTLKGGLVDISLQPDQKYPVRGSMDFEGTSYSVVALDNNPSTYQAVLVRQDGSLLNRVAAASPQLSGLIMVVYSLTISDPNVRMIRESTQNVRTTNGYNNFEIMYSGINSSGLNLTYREFSPDGMARVAFYQNLSYPADAKTITFKKYKIEITKATSDSITYTVINDGY